MSDVQRYTVTDATGWMQPWPTSLPAVMVRASDYERLERELAKARRTAEYWKAEHLAGNEQIDAARAEAEALRKEAARADYVRKAFLLDDNDAIFEFCLAESVAEFNAAIDAVLATRVPDAAIAKEQKP